MSEQLTARENLYVQARLQGQNKSEAGVSAGFSGSMARSAVAKIEKPHVVESLRQALERRNVTSDRLARKLSAGLEATRVIATKDGLKPVKDFGEIRQHIELAAKLRGDLDSAQVSVTFNQAILGVPEEFAGMFGLIETPCEDVMDGASMEGESVRNVTPQDVVNHNSLCVSTPETMPETSNTPPPDDAQPLPDVK